MMNAAANALRVAASSAVPVTSQASSPSCAMTAHWPPPRSTSRPERAPNDALPGSPPDGRQVSYARAERAFANVELRPAGALVGDVEPPSPGQVVVASLGRDEPAGRQDRAVDVPGDGLGQGDVEVAVLGIAGAPGRGASRRRRAGRRRPGRRDRGRVDGRRRGTGLGGTAGRFRRGRAGGPLVAGGGPGRAGRDRAGGRARSAGSQDEDGQNDRGAEREVAPAGCDQPREWFGGHLWSVAVRSGAGQPGGTFGARPPIRLARRAPPGGRPLATPRWRRALDRLRRRPGSGWARARPRAARRRRGGRRRGARGGGRSGRPAKGRGGRPAPPRRRAR